MPKRRGRPPGSKKAVTNGTGAEFEQTTTPPTTETVATQQNFAEECSAKETLDVVTQAMTNGYNVTPFPASSSHEVPQDIMRGAVVAPAAAADPYGNLMAEAVKGPDSYGADKAQTVLGAIPVRSPTDGEFLRCHPTFCPQFHLYLSPYTKRTFLVFNKLMPLFGPKMARLHTMRMLITPQQAAFIWPVKVGIATNDLSMTYARSRDSVVAEIIKRWMSVRQTGGLWSSAPPHDPTIFPEKLLWPAGDDNAWLALAFRGNIIDSSDHDEIQYLLGKKLP